MPRLPVVSGDRLIKVLLDLGYEVARQKGSHVRLEKKNDLGVHKITVPKHQELAKGTLGDILNSVSLHNHIPKDKLLEMLR